jgi:hypothetical protein
MPNSFRIKTEIGVNKVLPVKLDQQFDTLEILSLAVFPNDIYTRSCSDFGVLCGRVFANRGFGIANARISVFIPLEEIDETNPIISTLYPYKRTEDFNEDGYKYNLLPYTQSHSGHVPVGTFPERIDALTNKSVIEVYDKYYKFTAKTNESGDFMIFGLPIGQHNIFMQVDLSDIGEFSLTPQDLIRMGRATETQIDGVKFKFSENYSELPQIVTIEKTIQVAPFYGEKDICDHYIVRTDFDLTTEAGVELKPTSVFMGSIISHNNRKKIKKRCKVPAKAGWLCDLITGPGQIEAIRQTIFKDSYGRPILEEFTLENSGKVIDDNGTWVLEVPMNLDYVYTNEDGKKVLSDNPDLGVPTRAKYRFKVKWNQSPKVGEENKRGYFLVPNVKEWGWVDSDSENKGGSVTNTNWNITSPTKFIGDTTITYAAATPPAEGPREVFFGNLFSYYAVAFQSSVNVDSFKILVKNPVTLEYEENPDYKNYIPLYLYEGGDIRIEFVAIDPTVESKFTYRVFNEGQYKQECSYTFSLNWADYGTQEMIDEAVNCEDRFYQMSYNKVYTVSQLIDRFAWQTFPQKAVEIKHITETKCEGDYNPFPSNDVYYRYDIIFLILSFVMNFIIRPVLIAVIIIFHVLAWLFNIFIQFYPTYCSLRNAVRRIKCRLYNFYLGWPFHWRPFAGQTCLPEIDCSQLPTNPFLNLRLGVFLYTDDGCERCKCNISQLDVPNDSVANELANYNNEISNTAALPDFTTTDVYQLPNLTQFTPESVQNGDDFFRFIPQIFAGGSGNLYNFNGMSDDDKPFTFLLPFAADTLYGGKVLQFSPNLTLGERVNLFNTRMKYFDNPGLTSPGNVGWNQIKVTWWPELNSASPVAPTTNVDGAYTTKINNQNVWVIEGNQSSLLNQTIYIWNNSSSLQQIVPTNEYYEIVVTSTEYVQDIIGGQTYDYTILKFSSVTTNEIFSAPVVKDDFQWCNPANSFCQTPPYYDIDNDASYNNGFPGLTWDLFNMFPSELIGTTAAGGYYGGSPDLTALIGSTIWVRKANTSTFTYYVEGNPSTLFDLSNTQDTEFKIEEIIKYEFGSSVDPVFRAKLSDPINGQILIPYPAFKRFQVRKNNGVKFSWSTEEPPSVYDTFHLDNVLVMLVESNNIATGDLLTFQNPELSSDPNAGKPVGARIDNTDGYITVKYCDPNAEGTNGIINTTYVTPFSFRENWVSPFKRDIEYFQAISVLPLSAMTEYRAPLDTAGDNRFSLPWRFLDSSNGKSVKREIFQQGFSYGITSTQPLDELCADIVSGPFYDAVQEWPDYRNAWSFSVEGPNLEMIALFTPPFTTDRRISPPNGYINNYRGAYEYNGEGATYTNDFRVYRHQREIINDTTGYTGMRGYNDLMGGGKVVQYSPFARAFQMASPPNCGDLNDVLIGGTTDIWDTIDTSRYKIVFLQRGVDPHSGKIPVRYDLSRLFGFSNYDVNANLYNTTTNTFGFPYIVEGEFRMNIPIQGRINSIANPYDIDMKGFSLPIHTNFNTNSQIIEGQKLFYPSYLYQDNPTRYSGDWTTTLHKYYSALDTNAVRYSAVWASSFWGNISSMTDEISDDEPFLSEDKDIGLLVNESNNLFCYTFDLNPQSYTIPYQGAYLDYLINYLDIPGVPNFNGVTITAPCQFPMACTTNTNYGPNGLGYEFNHYSDIPALKKSKNRDKNNVSGYWYNEYVEGGSLMGCAHGNLSSSQGYIGGMKYYFALGQGTEGFAGAPGYYDNILRSNVAQRQEYTPVANCNECYVDNTEVAGPNLNQFEYFSPTYITVPFESEAAANWANPNHEISMTSNFNIVFRSDRLPTSTTVTQYGNNGFLMHQNNTFAIFIINDEGVAEQEGGYGLPDQANGTEIDTNELPAENEAIINSLIDCAYAVNLNSYDVDADGNPYIKNNDPFSVKINSDNNLETYFVRNMGCYNFVSVPFKSLFGVPDRINGGGGDIASAVEWTRRTVLNFSLCFEIYSHTFSNNWINGTLYHYPFQLNTIFGSDNQPIRDYCRHVIYFHEPNQTFYYRSSPWNGTDFIGKENPGRMVNNYGNDKQLMYPTTILDMGPKTNYLQELVYSDEYDGYIISKIPTTSFNNVTDLLNIFVLSRLVNTNFLQQLIPTNASGNQEGSDDPSVTGFFKNTRWANGDAFFNSLLPSVVDADYSQMLSINSEFGVKEYGPELYTNNDIWFINDNNGNSVFGITLKSDNQDRDYVSPRRTIWNDNSPVPPIPGDFTQIPVNTQKVPSYQWVIRYQYDNTANDPLQYPSIFGMQSNDFWTNAPSPQANDLNASTVFINGFFWTYYQRLDRFNDSSEYFKTDIDNITKYYKAHIINYEPVVDAAGNIILNSLGNVSAYTETANAPAVDKRRYAYTFGAPFHFYFGLIQGASAMDRFRTKYVDTNIQYE